MLSEQNFFINCKGKLIDLSTPKIMGILNLTPDSFSDGGQFNSEKLALQQVERMISEGADFIDIGAQSTRPNADLISAKEEISRIGNLISLIKKEFPDILISLDTFYAEVVKFGFDQGIDLVNDISGGNYDENLLKTVAETGLPYVLMHSPISYESMHNKNIEDDVTIFINRYFSQKVSQIYTLGIKDVILDPGFGFGKTIVQNHQMIDDLPYIGFDRLPLLVGISRKSFIYKPLDKMPLEIGEETQVLHQRLLEKGAKILRVHDVAATKKTFDDFFLKG